MKTFPKSAAQIDDDIIDALFSAYLQPQTVSAEISRSEAKYKLFVWLEEITADHALVKADQLQAWLEKIKAHNALKSELETDIGYVAIALNNLTGIKNPMPLLMKLISGKITPAELGLDMDRIQAIAEKYAPVTCAKIKEDAEQKKK